MDVGVIQVAVDLEHGIFAVGPGSAALQGAVPVFGLQQGEGVGIVGFGLAQPQGLGSLALGGFIQEQGVVGLAGAQGRFPVVGEAQGLQHGIQPLVAGVLLVVGLPGAFVALQQRLHLPVQIRAPFRRPGPPFGETGQPLQEQVVREQPLVQERVEQAEAGLGGTGELGHERPSGEAEPRGTF